MCRALKHKRDCIFSAVARAVHGRRISASFDAAGRRTSRRGEKRDEESLGLALAGPGARHGMDAMHTVRRRRVLTDGRLFA